MEIAAPKARVGRLKLDFGRASGITHRSAE